MNEPTETPRSRDHHRWVLAWWVPAVFAGCRPTSAAIDMQEAEESDVTPSPAGGSTGPTPSSSSSDDDGPRRGESDGGGPPSTFLDNTDVGESFECSTFRQDCPAGHKCNGWANDGGGAWNSTRCFPVGEDPDQVGETRTVVGSGVSGMDSCDVSSMCWAVDPETNQGTCAAFCTGDESHPVCPDPGTQCGGPRFFPLCLPTCCPLEQDCPEGQACYPVHHDFECAPDVSGEQGVFGDPCEFINVCDPGFACLGDEAIVECEAAGCCTAFCEVGFDGCGDLQNGLECVPWFEPHEAPPGLEHVGMCMVPS